MQNVILSSFVCVEMNCRAFVKERAAISLWHRSTVSLASEYDPAPLQLRVITAQLRLGGVAQSHTTEKSRDNDTARHRPNENKISDGYRERALIEMEVFLSLENLVAERVAVRCIVWLGLFW